MNIENIKNVITAIKESNHTEEDSSAGFNMESYTHNCGTASCIGGYAVALSNNLSLTTDDLYEKINQPFFETAINYLGLDEDTAGDLFFPYEYEGDSWAEITPDMAVKVLENLIVTGRADWGIV